MAMFNKETLEDLYINRGMTQQQISDMYNCDRKNVGYYLKKFGIKKDKQEIYKQHHKEKPTAQQVLKYIDEGYTMIEIAEMYDISRGVLTRVMKDAGYNMRNHKGQTKRQSQRMKIDNPFNNKDVAKKATVNLHKSKNENFNLKISMFDNSMTFKDYSKKARHLAYDFFNKNIPKGFSVDHRYSVYDGYKNNVPLTIISNPNNLRIISVKENNQKGKDSIITLGQLYKEAEEWRN